MNRHILIRKDRHYKKTTTTRTTNFVTTYVCQYLKPLHSFGVWIRLDFARKEQLSGRCCNLFWRRYKLLFTGLTLHHGIGSVAQTVCGDGYQTSLQQPRVIQNTEKMNL